ncbi:MAG: hypothetical protein EOL87_07730 [Spartobacteria bacterium]|nr:hypothetical protein [Spartobacteria bacterium]
MNKTGMILIASEQLWPNIQGLMHWQLHVASIDFVCICHTASDRFSKQPAYRLRDFICTCWPNCRVELTSDTDPLPHVVTATIRKSMQSNPMHRWIINATGGTKLMFAGALQCTGMPGVSMIYREISGDWYTLTQSPSGLRTVALSVDPGDTDRIPVPLLLALQTNSSENTTWHWQEPLPLVLPEILQRLETHGFQYQWLTEKTFTHESDKGHVFEAFLTACIKAIGITSVVWNASLARDKGSHLIEVDIVANHRGKLYLFDCKTGTNSRPATQAKESASNRQSMGGAASVCIIVRPDHTLQEDQRLLMDSMKMQYIDASHLPRLFSRLCELFGIAVTPRIQQMDKSMKTACSHRQQAAKLPPLCTDKPAEEVVTVECTGVTSKNGLMKYQILNGTSEQLGFLTNSSPKPDNPQKADRFTCKLLAAMPKNHQFHWLGE